MRTATDKHRFEVVWKGSWYWLGSLSDHHHAGIDPTGPVLMLLDRLYHRHLAPREEVHIPPNPL